MFERFGADQRSAGFDRVDRDARTRIAHHHAFEQRRDRHRRRCVARAAPRAIPRKPRQQGGQPFGRIAQRHQHVGAKRRVFGVARRVVREQAQLAGQVLDVVHHEGDAAVEILEPRGFEQRLVAGLFGEIAGELAPDHAQQIEILPIERARERGTAQHHHAHQPAEMEQRHDRPGALFGQQPSGHRRTFAVMIDTAPDHVEIDDETVAFEEACRVARQHFCGEFERAPLPARGQRQHAAFVGRHQEAARAVGNVGQHFDHAFGQRGFGRSGAADRFGEAQPLGAVIVPMLEEMLGHRHLEPAAQARRGQERQAQRGRPKRERKLDQVRRPCAQPRQRARCAHHHDQV